MSGISAETLAASMQYTDKTAGSIDELKTKDKSSLVAAINELYDILNNNEFIVSASNAANEEE